MKSNSKPHRSTWSFVWTFTVAMTLVASCQSTSVPVRSDIYADARPKLPGATLARLTTESSGSIEELALPEVEPLFALASTRSAMSGWDFKLAPYAWLTDVSGTIQTPGTVIPIDLAFNDLLDLADDLIGVQLFFSGRKGNSGFIADLSYLDLGIKEGPLEVDTELTIFELDYTYSPPKAESLTFIAGLRALDLDVQAKLAGVGTATAGVSTIDPVIGAIGRWELSDDWTFLMRGDIGGFGVDSEFTSQLLGALEYRMGDSWNGVFGWRQIEWEIDGGARKLDLQFSGPFLGLFFEF